MVILLQSNDFRLNKIAQENGLYNINKCQKTQQKVVKRMVIPVFESESDIIVGKVR